MHRDSVANHARRRRTAVFRFYEELNDFLPEEQRKKAFTHAFTGTPAVKDVVEALGVPHAEVDLILVDGESVGFDRKLTGGERVSVYPMFERLDIGSLTRLRAQPLRTPRFILDVHLGRLARYLRMLGFDTLYRNDYDDATIVAVSVEERRIILTRDRGLLKHGDVTHGYWVRATQPEEQVREVVRVFDLRDRFEPLTRCIACNGVLEQVEKEKVAERLPDGVRERHETFVACPKCERVYWAGSHYDRMQEMIRSLDGS